MSRDPDSNPRSRATRRFRSIAVPTVVALAAVALSGPIQAGPEPTLTLDPPSDTNPVGTQHTVVGHLQDGLGNPMPGQPVFFSVTGPNPQPQQPFPTDGAGDARFTYPGGNPGTDQIFAFADILVMNEEQDPGEPSDTATKTWQSPEPPATPQPHVKKDPRKDDWPKLTAEEMKSVQDLIDGGKNAEALAKLVEIMKKYCCSFDTMEGGAPIYDPKLDDEGSCERKKGGKVRIGKAAFTSAAWLYSSLKHEMVHSSQWQDEDAAKKMGSKGREKEAYQREIDQAGNTGISDKEKKELEKRIKAYK